MAEIPEWLLGPPGDLRPLPPPDTEITNTVARFGGVHTAITGGRTVDTLGYRSNYEFSLSHIQPEEYFWLEALHTQTVPGPFKLIDPLRKNLLTRESGIAKPADASRKGLTPGGFSTLRWIRSTDSPVQWSQRVAVWSGLELGGAGSSLDLDARTSVPVTIARPSTVSAYVRPSEALSLRWVLTPSDATGSPQNPIQGQTEALQAGEWTRISHTFTPETPAVSVFPSLEYVQGTASLATTSVEVANPQLEYGQEATEPTLGGGSVTVAIDALETHSPRYPLQSVTLSLLEV